MTSQANRAISGSGLVIGATLFAGIGGYAIVTLLARSLGEGYGEFAVFWALFYLAIGTFAGIQQEVSRGTPLNPESKSKTKGVKLLTLALQQAVVVAVLTSVAMVFFSPLFFSEQTLSLSSAVVSGTTLSVLLGVLAGGLYGTNSWKPLAFLIFSDVLFRLIILGIVSSFTHDVSVLAWVCSIPYVLVLVCVIPMSKKTLNMSTTLDVDLRQSYRNIARTVGASFGTSLLVSGFPALLVVSEGMNSQTYLGPVIYALTLTRAPLVVGILALQSFLIVKFREFAGNLGFLILKMCSFVLLVGLLISTAAFLFGDQVLVLFAGLGFSLSPLFLFLLTLSSVPTAMLAITGAATLSKKLHNSYSIAWLISAGCSIAVLFLPFEMETKLLSALVMGPLIGVALNIFSLYSLKKNN